MKNILLLVCLSFTIGCVAQQNFDQLDRMDQIQAVVVTPKMFDLMAKVKMDESDKEAARYLAMIKNLTHLTLYTTEDKPTATHMRTVVDEYVAEQKLTEVTRFAESGKKISLYTKQGVDAQLLSEILLFVESSSAEETVLFSLRGSIDVNEVAFLSERLKLPGKEAIQKTVKAIK